MWLNEGEIMNLTEILIKKKTKKKKKKLLKEGMFDAQQPIKIGNEDFTPPFFPYSNTVLDYNHKELCKCADESIAKYIADCLSKNCGE